LSSVPRPPIANRHTTKEASFFTSSPLTPLGQVDEHKMPRGPASFEDDPRRRIAECVIERNDRYCATQARPW
jgi:hypothetical protein